MGDRIYCYPNSEVLINKLNIHDKQKLYEAERRITMLRLSDLIDKPLEGKFDFRHLQSIHQYIFQDIYFWAGKVRTVDIAKSNMFCKVKYINIQAKEIFTNLKVDKYLYGLSEKEFIEKNCLLFRRDKCPASISGRKRQSTAGVYKRAGITSGICDSFCEDKSGRNAGSQYRFFCLPI